MRTVNYIFSVISIVIGLAFVLLILTQTSDWDLLTTVNVTKWSIGTAIGVILVANGLIRLWFLQDDEQ